MLNQQDTLTPHIHFILSSDSSLHPASPFIRLFLIQRQVDVMAASMSSTVILPENTVKYRLYPLIRTKRLEDEIPALRSPTSLSSPSASSFTTSSNTTSNPSSPTRSSPTNQQPTQEQLSLYVMESLAKLNAFLSNYIWQNEPLNLHVRTDSLIGTQG